MNNENSVFQGVRKGKKTVVKDRRMVKRLLFSALFVAFIVSTFFIYDIVLFAMDVSSDNPEGTMVVQEDVEVASLSEELPIYRAAVENLVVSASHPFVVTLKLDGNNCVATYEPKEQATVGDLLAKFDVDSGEDVTVNYSSDTPLQDGMVVEVGRITYEYETKTETIPAVNSTGTPVIYAVFSGRASGSGLESSNGEKEVTRKIKYVNGEEVSSEIVSEVITRQPVNSTQYADASYLLDRGDGVPSSYEAVLDCTFTAYSPSSDGGSRTSTGYPAQVGYVAVDPNVIPLYSKLYIVMDNGFVYGYAYAMDTGGSIKGNVVDIYLPSHFDSYAFGRRTGKVYIVSYGE